MQVCVSKYHELNIITSPGKSYNLNPHWMLTQSSMFCTIFYLSPSASSENYQHIGNPPFLPHPLAYNQCISSSNSLESPLLLGGDIADKYDKGFSGLLMKGSLMVTKLLEVWYLSEELDIPVSKNGENPNLVVRNILLPLLILQISNSCFSCFWLVH